VVYLLPVEIKTNWLRKALLTPALKIATDSNYIAKYTTEPLERQKKLYFHAELLANKNNLKKSWQLLYLALNKKTAKM